MLVGTKSIAIGDESGWYRGKLSRLSSHCGREVFLLTTVIARSASCDEAISLQIMRLLRANALAMTNKNWRYECWIN